MMATYTQGVIHFVGAPWIHKGFILSFPVILWILGFQIAPHLLGTNIIPGYKSLHQYHRVVWVPFHFGKKLAATYLQFRS